MKKILAWLMFGTTCVLFMLCFCRQQLDVQAAEAIADARVPVIHWDSMPDPSDQCPTEHAATTRPSQLPARPSVASNEVGDALK